MTVEKQVIDGLSPSDVVALHDAWQRLKDADRERAAAVVDLFHVCTQVGLRTVPRLRLVPGTDEERTTAPSTPGGHV